MYVCVTVWMCLYTVPSRMCVGRMCVGRMCAVPMPVFYSSAYMLVHL